MKFTTNRIDQGSEVNMYVCMIRFILNERQDYD
jgi:hypothetical protein